ncbi:helix-turn-helix transcriptional regulator [Streptomyces marispadix]|uniref:AAA family ATPase n=1 Tax=Streptomyces marispadix TaxID=2922868 RepID=A0ABS9T2M3_9ACTN|nr:helix-turn-helix transcriptional regulator [Streptomyces marispadix]MCH6162779.1 AAA family ATPase [Streptomyces marispadix]
MLDDVSSHSTVSPVFVGRGDELTLLDEALARADAGEPQALLLGGEAGVGKTRLLEEFLSAAATAGAVTAVGGCLELGADGLPFAPFATALRGLHRALGEAELSSAVAGREAELARLLPDLAPPPGSPAAALAEAYDEEDGRARLFELTAQLLERLASGRTVVIALEDLHWADRSTRELLGYLYRSVHTSRLLLLATYRSDDIHRRHPLRPFLAELDRLRTVRRVELPRLSRVEVQAQIAGIQGVPEPDPEQARVIFERSEGNPFFVEELTANSSACGISDSLRDLLLVRVEALPEPVQQVLRIAAQGGSAVEHALLAAVCRLPEAELLDALRIAVGANVLLPTDDGDGYRFRHALLREAVSEDLLPGEAAGLNRRYAQALEADPSLVRSEQCTTRLAHYWYHGRDAAKALPAVLGAAVEARRRHAFAEQHQLLERAIELWHEVPAEIRERLRPIDEAEVYPRPGGCPGEPAAESLSFMDLLAEAVVAARTGGDVERALALTRRALDLLDEETDSLRAAWFWVSRSKSVEALGRGDGWDEIARAQELVRGLPPSAVHADVLTSAAGWGVMHRPGPDAMSTAVRAVELARVVGATTIELQARITLGILMAESGDLDAGIAEMTQAREQALRAGAFGVVGRADINIATELESMGRSSEAVAAAVRAAEGAATHGRPDMCGFALGNQAESLYAMGEWDQAARITEEAATAARSAETRGFAALMRAHLQLGRGDLAALETTAAAAREALGSHATSVNAAVQLRHFALEAAAGRGDFTTVRTELRAAIEAGFAPGTHRYAWPLLHAGAVHEAGLRGLPAAEEGRAEVLADLRTAVRRLPHPAPVWTAYSALVTAEIGRAEGSSEPDAWEAVTRAFEELERPYHLALARQRWAEALLEAGAQSREARECAHGLLASAHQVAARLGAQPLRTEIEQLSVRARLPVAQAVPAATGESHAAPARSGEPADAFGLTRRERDVLHLVAAGRSNRQIAEQLFISPKTASVHVSNILAKLGVDGRGEAAAMAYRLRLLTDADRRPAAG